MNSKSGENCNVNKSDDGCSVHKGESKSKDEVQGDPMELEESPVAKNENSSEDGGEKRKEEHLSEDHEEKEETSSKTRRAKRRKISWKRMNPALFQEIFQWETTQPKVKQSQIEKKFNVNRSTYYRWKKKYLAQ